MTALIVLAAVLLLLLFILSVKCRAEASYDENGFRWRVKLGFIPFAPGEKRNRRAGEKKRGEKPEEKKHTLELADLSQLRDLAQLALRLLKRFFRRLRIERLRVHFVSAFDDPYNTAMAYGYAGEAMEAVTALANGRIRDLDLHTQPDFDSAQPRLEAQTAVYVRLGDLILLAISALRGYRAITRRAKKEKENEHGKSVDR